MKFRIFISSVQREFAKERRELAKYIRGDALFGKFFDVFLFEETPAASISARNVYLREASECDVYLGLVGAKYGTEDANGVSPTEREYDAASKASRHVLVFVKGGDVIVREPKESAFLRRIESERVRRSFQTVLDLRDTLAVSLVRFLEEQGRIQSEPFDACVAQEATMRDLSVAKMRDFVKTAREIRGFRLPLNVPARDLLRHLDLIRADGGITNAAILLFGKRPQRFFINSEVKCAQFYGVRVEKPMADHQIYQGDVFELADQATRFVMTHVSNWVGTRSEGDSVIVPTRHELPYDAVKEAIVNAICHRDYTSHQSVQVMLFADRLEVWNAGRLPRGLTIADLKRAHSSLPPNELLALPMYLKGAIEKTGTGTEDMVRQCRNWGLPDPVFSDGPDFRIVIRRPARSGGTALGAGNGMPADGVLPPSTSESTQESTLKSTLKSTLNATDARIVELIASNGVITIVGLATRIGLSRDGVRKAVKRLKSAGIVRRVGPDKGGHWEIVAKSASDGQADLQK